MANRLFKIIDGVAHDVMLHPKYRISDGVAVPFQDGDIKVIDGTAYPITRDAAPLLGIQVSGGNMTFSYGYNHILKVNPKIVFIGSSHGVSLGLSGEDTMQYKFQQLANQHWSGATIINLCVPGSYSDNWKPTALGGIPDRNIDAAKSHNPDIIFLIGPTNDAAINTPEQATGNLRIIAENAGTVFFFHSPLRRGDYNSQQLANLATENVLWNNLDPYKIFPLYDVFTDPQGPDFQTDHIHLSPQATTKQAEVMFSVADRELRANTAYLRFEIERSDTESDGFAIFDTITDQQTIRKEYPLQSGYYRVRGLLKDNTYTPYSKVLQVVSGSNQPPTASPGNDQDLEFGSTTVNLSGSGTDPDGTITGYFWSLLSGPNTPSITSPNSQNTAVTGLIGGAYIFRLTVTDNNGVTASDDVRVRVVSKVMRVILSKTTPTVVPPGWNKLDSDPVSGAPSVIDQVGGTGFIFRSRGEANFNHTIGPSNAQNDWGQSVDLGSGFFSSWPPAAFANYHYNPFDNFTSGKYQYEWAALDPSKDTRLKMIGSRSNANGSAGPFSTRYNVNWAAGNQQYEIAATFQNTANGIIGEGRPLSDGTLPLAFNIGATGSVAHLNALTIEQF